MESFFSRVSIASERHLDHSFHSSLLLHHLLMARTKQTVLFFFPRPRPLIFIGTQVYGRQSSAQIFGIETCTIPSPATPPAGSSVLSPPQSLIVISGSIVHGWKGATKDLGCQTRKNRTNLSSGTVFFYG